MNNTEKLKEAGIGHLSYSAMKDLRNNEYIFKMHYIDRIFDDVIYLSSIIGSGCHYGVNYFLQKHYDNPINEDIVKIVINESLLFVFKKYITQNKKYEKFYSDFNAILETYQYFNNDDLITLISNYNNEDDKVKKIEEQTAIYRMIRKLDENLPDNIKWGVRGSMATIIDGITCGLTNWFNEVYPTLKGLSFYDGEMEFITEINHKDGVYDLPLKSVIDAIFKDDKGNYYIYDWKFKTALLEGDEDGIILSPSYDIQGTTYFVALKNYLNLDDSVDITVRVFELTMSKPKPEYFLQKDLRAMCDQHGIDWYHGGANAKYMTNDQMTECLVIKGVIKIKPCSLLYSVEPNSNKYLLDIWHTLYRTSIERLLELFVNKKELLPNFFDGNFDGGNIIYKDYIKGLLQL